MDVSTASQPEPLNDFIASFRDASRQLVREWGFLRPVVADILLSPAAVHCLIEIGDVHSRCSSRLRAELRVPQEDLDGILSELIAKGYIAPDNAAGDAFHGVLDTAWRITETGTSTLQAINQYGQDQVSRALSAVPPGAATEIVAAFRLYTAALERAKVAAAVATPENSRPASPKRLPSAPPTPPPPTRQVAVMAGYRPGLISSCLQMHMNFYNKAVGWGFEFETGLGTTLIEVVNRLHHPLNQAWSAVETISPQTPELPVAERILGTIFIDGQVGNEGTAKLRAFIVDDSARGLGLGRKLMNAAMAFVVESKFSECRLTTMRSLFAARKLYEQMGFKEVAEIKKQIWGVEVMELEYCWTRPDNEKTEALVL